MVTQNSLEARKERHLQADFVIIGGGGAGLAAAVTAAGQGADVIVLEKRNCTGGNTALASGMFAAESPTQKRAMVDASCDELFKAMIDWAHWRIDPLIVRAYIDKSGDTIRWLEELGCSFDLSPFIPNQVPVVTHRPTRRAMVTDMLRKSCDAMGVRILVHTEAQKILSGPDGEVAAVTAIDGCREFVVRTRHVLIATGGFGGNQELLRQYSSNYLRNMHCLGLPNMGDGIRMGMEVGAATEGLGMLQIEGPCVPRSVRLAIDVGDSEKLSVMLTQIVVEPYTLWVNKNGHRFVDETFGHSPFVVANSVARQPDGICYSIMDQAIVETMSEKGITLARGALGKELGSRVGGLERELRLQSETATLSFAQVDTELCNGCGICVDSCPLDIIGLDTVVAESEESSPCRSECPAGIDIRGYMNLMKHGLIDEAALKITEAMPFAAITGRVCPHPCESKCARMEVDEAVNINSIERFLGDWLLSTKTEPIPKIHTEKTAIIGSGPAGLACACYLRQLGYPVTVFDALPVPGGMLRIGIPEYRLPKDVLDSQIRCLENMGVEFRVNITVGKDITFRKLQEEHEAIFLAMGSGLSRKIPVEGVDHSDVLWGLDFLCQVNLKKEVKVGKKIVVIGGGNVAVDVALTTLRLGAEKVRMVCLETGDAIPAHRDEMAHAIAEGVEIEEGWGPLRIIRTGQTVTGVEFGRCASLYDESGRFSPSLDEKTLRALDADMVFLAVGQMPDLSAIPDGVSVSGSGTIQIDPITGATSLPGVFAGGDIVSGASTVVNAITAGTRAAISIDRYYRKVDLKAGREGEKKTVKNPPREGIQQVPRIQTPLLSVTGREKNFCEVATGFDEDMAYLESQRCMTCGSRATIDPVEECRLCQACERACPQKAASIKPAVTGAPLVKIADSWEEIAAWIGIEAETLKRTVEDYNTACDRGHDPVFVKDRRHLLPLRTPPYYAVRCGVDYLDTIGGIKINERMEVLDKEGRAIPGLYAAGIDTGGWVGDTYCIRATGTTFAFAINSGRIAGESVVASLRKNSRKGDGT